MTHTIQPIDFIEGFLAEQRRVREVFMSIYRNHPQSLMDDRISYRVPVAQLRARYEALACNLRKNEEIAFHSLVRTGGPTGRSNKHLPLVDFRSRDRSSVEKTAQTLIGEYAVERAALFESGRSFHLYLGLLLSQEVWVKFMGRLLLLNARQGPILTDARWVGHRLMGGYGALRWSANTSPYAKFGTPWLVREW